MSKSLSLSLCTIGCLYATTAQAQVSSDGTVNTQINQNGNVAEITGGETRGANLFHSFQNFSVPVNNEAFFNNAESIANIFSRVTGGNVSNIDGLIRANDTASLFLINPAGIVFGEGAQLELGGSFYGSTASSILFEDGEFSAVDNIEQPILTVNAPIGLGFRDNPEDIVNRSFAQNEAEELVGLEVLSEQTLALVGGDLNFEAGEATAKGGNIYLGGLAEAGIVGLNEDGILSFPEDVTLSNITLTNAADVDVRSTGGGSIAIDAQNLSLEAGEFGSSFIQGGIASNSTSIEAQAGDITINVAENLTLNDSRITNQVNSEGVGNSGNITVNTGSLELTNGGIVDASTFNRGNAGAVSVTATGDITATGENSEGFPSGITSLVDTDAEGDAGGVAISTTNLNLTDGGRVDASTLGQGNAGAVNVTATGDITATRESPKGFVSGITSLVNTDGDAGGVTISTANLNLTDGGRVDASTLGQGNAGAVSVTATGDITATGENSEGFPSGITSLVDTDAEGDAGGVAISTTNLNLTDGGRVDASTLGQGNAGAVNVTATGDITADGDSSSITSLVASDAEGNSGGVTIFTTNLSLTNGGQVDASTLGTGDAGAVNVTAKGNINIGNPDANATSFIDSRVEPDAEGNAGGVTISTANLNLIDGGRVDASTLGIGNAGAVNVTAEGDITASGENSEGFVSGITSQVNPDAEGNAGGVTISTANLNLIDGGRVDASTLGIGNAGAVNVTAEGDITASGENSEGFVSGITSQVNPGAEGNAGGVTISTANLNLIDGGRVAASTLGIGNAGAVNVTAEGDITASGENSEGIPSGITSQVNPGAEGNAGGVTIFTTNLNLSNGGRVDASTGGRGNAGAVNITAMEDITADGDFSGIYSLVASDAIGDSGGVSISTANLSLTNGGNIDASTFGRGNAGAVNVTAEGDITASGENSEGFVSGITSQVNPGAEGNAGGVTISTANLSLTNGGRVDASTLGIGNAGAVNVTAEGDITATGENSEGFPSGITSLVDTDAEGDAGGVTISTTNLNLSNGGRVDASTFGKGDAGAVNVTATGDITASGENSQGFQSGITSTIVGEGNSEGVTISTTNLNLTNGGRVIADTFGKGDAGAVNVTATGDITASGETSEGFASGITSRVNPGAEGDAGGVTISTTNLNLTNGGRVDADTLGTGNANNVIIDASESISIEGAIARFRSGISANALYEDGNGGDILIDTGNLTIANGGTIEATNLDNLGDDDPPGTGRPGNINIRANSIELTDLARIEAATQFTEGISGNIDLTVAENITLENNSFISAQAIGEADGGNLSIDARYIIAYPSNGTGNDLVATADRGTGGNIDLLDVNGIFGLQPRNAVAADNQLIQNGTNDIDASSNVEGFDGTILIDPSSFIPIQGVTELPANIVVPEETVAQACSSNRERLAQSGFTISGKGGITPNPSSPLDALNIYVDGEDTQADIPEAVETAKGEIQPARGVRVTEKGIMLTAYRTNNAGDRIPEDNSSCGI